MAPDQTEWFKKGLFDKIMTSAGRAEIGRAHKAEGRRRSDGGLYVQDVAVSPAGHRIYCYLAIHLVFDGCGRAFWGGVGGDRDSRIFSYTR